VKRWNAQILEGTPEAKALYWTITDAERRKLGEQTGLDTLVVLAVNDEYWMLGIYLFSIVANALSILPGKYTRKGETQRN
jgi:hypothetical protein